MTKQIKPFNGRSEPKHDWPLYFLAALMFCLFLTSIDYIFELVHGVDLETHSRMH